MLLTHPCLSRKNSPASDPQSVPHRLNRRGVTRPSFEGQRPWENIMRGPFPTQHPRARSAWRRGVSGGLYQVVHNHRSGEAGVLEVRWIAGLQAHRGGID